MATKLYWEDVNMNDEFPPFARTTGLMESDRLIAADKEHVTFHMDHVAGRDSDYPGAIGMGNLRLAYLHDMLMEWIGDEGIIKKVGCRFRWLNLEHGTLTCWGRVIDKEVKDGEYLIVLDVGVKSQDGRETAPGRAVVALPSKGG